MTDSDRRSDFLIHVTHHRRRNYSTKPLVRDVPQPKVLPPYAGPPDKSPEFGGASIQTLGHGSGGVRKGVGWVTTDILCISVLFFGRVRSQSRADPLWIPPPLQAPPTTVHPVPQPLTNIRTSGDSRWSPSSTETGHQAHQRRDKPDKKGRRPHPTPARTRSPAIFLATSGFHPTGGSIERRRPPRTSHGLAHVYPPGSRLTELSHSLSTQTTDRR